MFCREQVARLSKELPTIHAAGAELIAIGNGNVQHLEWFHEDQPQVEFAAYTDPGRRTFKAAGLNHGIATLAHPKVFLNKRRARKAGFTQNTIKGDARQQGGVMIVRRGGEVIYQWADVTGGDHAPMEQVLGALEDL